MDFSGVLHLGRRPWPEQSASCRYSTSLHITFDLWKSAVVKITLDSNVVEARNLLVVLLAALEFVSQV